MSLSLKEKAKVYLAQLHMCASWFTWSAFYTEDMFFITMRPKLQVEIFIPICGFTQQLKLHLTFFFVSRVL